MLTADDVADDVSCSRAHTHMQIVAHKECLVRRGILHCECFLWELNTHSLQIQSCKGMMQQEGGGLFSLLYR